jgi:hypothetical protein
MKLQLKSSIRCVIRSLCIAALALTAIAEPPPIRDLLGRMPMDARQITSSYDASVLPILVELLDDRDMARYLVNVVSAIGFVGGEAGVDVLIDYFENRFSGEVDTYRYHALRNVPLALGSAAARGSDKALTYLLNHLRPSDWRRKPPAWSHGHSVGDPLYRTLCVDVWLGLVTSGRPEARAGLVNLQNENDPDVVAMRKAIPWTGTLVETFDAALADRSARAAKRLEEQVLPPDPTPPSPTPEQRAAALRAAGAAELNWDGDRPASSRPLRHALSASEAAALRPVALAEFERISTAAMEQGFVQVVNDLADNAAPIRPFIDGEPRGPIPGSDRRVDSTDYDAGLAQALDILSAARARGLQYGEAMAYQFEDGRLAVIAPLVGTEEIRAARLPRGAPTVTISDSGGFQVYMVRYEGRWYWNPFGW